jgi:hypothetical protein
MTETKNKLTYRPFVKIKIMMSKYENEDYKYQFEFGEYSLDDIFNENDTNALANKFKKFINQEMKERIDNGDNAELSFSSTL